MAPAVATTTRRRDFEGPVVVNGSTMAYQRRRSCRPVANEAGAFLSLLARSCQPAACKPEAVDYDRLPEM